MAAENPKSITGRSTGTEDLVQMLTHSEVGGNNYTQDSKGRHSFGSANYGVSRYIWPQTRTSKYYQLSGLKRIQSQVVIRCPLGNIGELCSSSRYISESTFGRVAGVKHAIARPTGCFDLHVDIVIIHLSSPQVGSVRQSFLQNYKLFSDITKHLKIIQEQNQQCAFNQRQSIQNSLSATMVNQ